MIRYAYLWRDEQREGREEGVKDRPCVVVLAVDEEDGARRITVAPVSHSPPRAPGDAIAIPVATKRRLGLDDAPSWIVATEVNRFIWPGPDLRPIDDSAPSVWSYGLIPAALFEALKRQIVTRGRLGIVRR